MSLNTSKPDVPVCASDVPSGIIKYVSYVSSSIIVLLAAETLWHHEFQRVEQMFPSFAPPPPPDVEPWERRAAPMQRLFCPFSPISQPLRGPPVPPKVGLLQREAGPPTHPAVNQFTPRDPPVAPDVGLLQREAAPGVQRVPGKQRGAPEVEAVQEEDRRQQRRLQVRAAARYRRAPLRPQAPGALQGSIYGVLGVRTSSGVMAGTGTVRERGGGGGVKQPLQIPMAAAVEEGKAGALGAVTQVK